jgi:hypothetical protein
MAADDLGSSLQARPLLEALERHGVDFVVVGGVAGLAQGSSYPTFDLDVAYSREAANLRRLADALADIDVSLRGAPADMPFQPDAQTLASGANFTFDTDFGSFDILGDIASVSPETWTSRPLPTSLPKPSRPAPALGSRRAQ